MLRLLLNVTESNPELSSPIFYQIELAVLREEREASEETWLGLVLSCAACCKLFPGCAFISSDFPEDTQGAHYIEGKQFNQQLAAEGILSPGSSQLLPLLFPPHS